MLDEYDAVIRKQLQEGVVEPATAEVTGREFYLPHRAVLRQSAETTKLRVVYDASACAQEKAPSLNECLHAGPLLHNKLWSVIVRFHPVAVSRDLRRAFLRRSLYVDDLISGGPTSEKAKRLKHEATEIFAHAKLH